MVLISNGHGLLAGALGKLFKSGICKLLKISQHLKGILITTLGVIILSPDALLIRLLNADTWTVVFWRGLVFSIGISILMLVIYRGNTIKQFIKIGKPGLLIGLIFGFSSLFFTTAIQNTSIANTLVIISTSPMFAALFSRVFLKERISSITWISMVVITVAIIIIMSSSFDGSGLWGDLSACGTAILMAVSFTLTRRHKDINMVPAMALSGLVGATIAGVVISSTAGTFHLAAEVIPYLILAGFVVTLAFALITLGPRYMPAPEVSLIMPLETVLGSYLGWLFLNEKPSTFTLVGGIIVIITLTIHSWLSLKNSRVK